MILQSIELKKNFERFYFWGNEIGPESARNINESKLYSEDYEKNIFGESSILIN